MTLLHYIALVVKEKYPELATFYNELHFVDKAAAGLCPSGLEFELNMSHLQKWYEFLWIYLHLNSTCINLKSSVTVSLENVLLDVKELGKGKDLVRRECSLHDHAVLKGFLQTSDTQLDKLQKDAKTAEVSFLSFTKHFLNTKPDYLISNWIHL